MIDCSTSLLMESPPYRVWPAGYCRDLTCVSHAPLSVSAYVPEDRVTCTATTEAYVFFTTSSIGLLFTSHAAVVFYMLYIRTSIRACAPSSPTYSHDSRHDKSTVAQRPGGALNNCMIIATAGYGVPVLVATGQCFWPMHIYSSHLDRPTTAYRHWLQNRTLWTF